jgi:hypothetical protein
MRMSSETKTDSTVTVAPERPQKKRGRVFGKVYHDGPLFPEKVLTVREMRTKGASFAECGRAIGMSGMGARYLWIKWADWRPKEKTHG